MESTTLRRPDREVRQENRDILNFLISQGVGWRERRSPEARGPAENRPGRKTAKDDVQLAKGLVYRLTEVEEGATPMTQTTVTKGSGNVFRDLGFSEEKSAELILKSSLLQALQETIKDRGWKQVEAAARLGIDQAKVSKLLACQMAWFSIERLVNFLSLLGQDVEVTVRKAPRGRQLGTVRARTTRKLHKVAG